MNSIKYRICGNEILDISTNTKIEVRNATKDEKAQFIHKHWNFPVELPCNSTMWSSLCDTLNSLESSLWNKVWRSGQKNQFHEKCLNALKIKNNHVLSECIFKYKKDDITNNHIIQIDATYSYSETFEVEDEWGFPVRDSNGDIKKETRHHKYDKSVACTYPYDFGILLNVIEKYLTEKMDGIDVSKITNTTKFYIITQEYIRKWLKKGKNNRVRFLNFIQTYISDIQKFDKYFDEYKKIITRDDLKQFCASEQRVLDVDGKLYFEYENDCGFDIDKKHTELHNIIKKISNSYDPGEEKVEYAIKWCLAETNGKVVSIKKDCESKHRYGCIILRDEGFIHESQEYDHILVSSSGVVIIETKHWKGNIEIRPDGKWIRDIDNNGHVIGVESPLFQMNRHEALMRNILPNTPIFSILCFTNDSVILNGQNNFKDYPIIYVDQLKETLVNIFSSSVSKNSIDYIIQEIENHKINKI